MEYEWEHELVLDKGQLDKVTAFYVYRSSDAFDGNAIINSYADINGVYIRRDTLEGPPERMQITLRW
ncbi:MAG: hypothetical protein ABID84_04860 [Chloroflexota bacterium]